jgi:hypothetical protein
VVGEHNAVSIQEAALIRQLVAAGHSATAVGKMLNRTVSCIAKYAPLAGERFHKWTTWSVKRVPPAVQRRAERAAAQYQMPVETLIYQLAAGVLMRGSVDKSLQRYANYENAKRLDIANAHGTKER